MDRELYVSLSLGLFSKFFKKGKSFIKNKSNFLTCAGFLRKVLLFSSIRDIILVVKRIPMYLPEILTTINTPVIANYQNPLDKALVVDEMVLREFFYFHFFIFLGSRPYSFMKVKKRGRVKRKITKRIVKVNRLID
jgi:hypothetical protein